jgi:hypothetical protein
MITIRNADTTLSLSARTATADLIAGMIVAFVQSTASGDQPKVRKATIAEISDPTVVKGIVDFIVDDSLAVDFDISLIDQSLSPTVNIHNANMVIPLNAQVNVWLGKVVIAYHSSNLPAALKSGTVREGMKLSFAGGTNLPALYASGGVDGSQTPVGMVYRVDGPEVTMLITI